MNVELAKYYFPHNPEDDLYDVWEDYIFDQKQYFLTHAPMPVVWQTKLNRINKAHEAFLLLTGQQETQPTPIQTFKEPEFSDQLLTAFNEFHAYRTQFKTKVLSAFEVKQLEQIVKEWLYIERCYAQHWAVPESEENELKVLRSKEPDPMELYNDLKNLAVTHEITSIDQLKEKYNILPLNLQKEVKRLTLLAKN